jgi:hypothetical protein
MTALELLSQLREKGVELKTSGEDRLVIDAPRGTITEEFRSALTAHKAELLQILKAEQARNEPVVANHEIAASTLSAPSIFQQPIAKVPRRDENDLVAASTAEEVNQLQTELMRLRTEEEARRAEVDAARLAAEHALRSEQERWRLAEEEGARRRAEQEKKRIEAEARERAEEENRRQIADRELARVEEELTRMRAMEEARRADLEVRMREATQAHEAEINSLRRAEQEPARRRADEERRYLETEGRKKAQEDELRRRAEMRFRAVEEEIERVQAREAARIKAAGQSQRLSEEAARRRAEEEARRQAEGEARRRAEEEARLRAQIEAEMRAEAEERRKIEEEGLRRAEEEARRRAEEEAQRLAAEAARRQAEEEARRQAEEDALRRAAEEARLRAQDDARRQAEEQARLRAEADLRMKGEAETRQRAELEARIRAEIEAKIRGEEAERRDAEEVRRRAEHMRIVAEEADKTEAPHEYSLDGDRAEVDEDYPAASGHDNVTEVVEWFDVGMQNRDQVREIDLATPLTLPDDQFGIMQDDAGGEFQPVSVPETREPFEASGIAPATLGQLESLYPAERAAAVSNLPQLGGEEAFQQISAAFDDESMEVRSAAARAMFALQEDRAAAFTRALREAPPERRRQIGSAIASSGLAAEAIRNLTGESRDKTYDAFSLLFLMSKAGETDSLMRAIEDDSNLEVRLAVIKLLALSGQPDVLTAFRRMAVRGSLPPEVRSAVMEAIYQITSQTPAETPSMA